MKKSEWAPGVYENFMETYDYVTCIRGDGSYYGNGGVKCHKGTPATKKDLAAEKKKAKAGDKAAAAKVKSMEKYGVAGSAPKAKSSPAQPAAKKESAAPKSKAEQVAAIKAKREEYMQAMREKNFKKADKLRRDLDKLRKDAQSPEQKEQEQRMKDMKKRAAKQPEKTEVSADAKKALLTYAREEPKPPAYKSMNACGRGKKCTKIAQKDVDALDKALNEWPANTKGASHFRGFNAKGDRLAQYANLKPGDKIQDGGFGSYSRNPQIASNFSQGGGKGTRVIVESRSTALRGIERNARFKNEQEAILPRNTSQTVTEVRQVGDFLYVVVE